jgi:hypothetical protein
LKSNLVRVASRSEAAMGLALHDTANFILNLIRVYAPVDTGWLRDSYQKESLNSLHIIIGSIVNYSLIQEYGSSQGYRFTPHLRPAFHQGAPELARNMVKRARELS